MTTPDDRAAFERQRRAAAARMAEDKELRALAREVTIRADRYDYSYQWNWLGLPIIQMPGDIVATQEAVWETRPTVIVETGIARGGSLVLYASLLQLLGRGRVIGIDIDIRRHNRDAIESHPLAHRIELIEGSSVAPEVVAAVREWIGADDRVMVALDSNHTHDHVLAELRFYAPLVTRGQFLIVADTAVEDIPPQTHRSRPWGPGDNPKTALDAYLAECDRFAPDPWLDAKLIRTASPGGYLRCVK
ncbi:MAG: cephalosporin hydroxylase family protein [Alphaproteobacteria bacterium]